MNLTATGGSADTFLTVRPAGAPAVETSNLNVGAGSTRANGVVTGVDTRGDVVIMNAFGRVDVIVDVTGWFSGGFVPVSPERVLDSRQTRRLGPGEVRSVGLAPPAGVEVTAVALNVTLVSPAAETFLTVWSGGGTVPEASNLNGGPGDVAANVVLSEFSPGGRISVSNAFGTTDVLVDVMGWFTDRSGFVLFEPERAVDTRGWQCTGTFRPGETQHVRLVEHGLDVSAVALNVTLVAPSDDTFLTIWPSGDQRPDASSVNAPAGWGAVPNGLVVGVTDGVVSVYNAFGYVDVLIDVVGAIRGEAQTSESWMSSCDGVVESDPSMFRLPTALWDPLGLVSRADENRRFLGSMRMTVFACRSPQSASPRIDLGPVVAWLNGAARDYFVEVSVGRFLLDFVPVGMLDVPESTGSACLDTVFDSVPAGFDGAFATDIFGVQKKGGLGGGGSLWVSGGCEGLWDGCLSIVVHELGHAIGWTHSWHPVPGHETELWTEYLNPYDIVSGGPYYITRDRRPSFEELTAKGWLCELPSGMFAWLGDPVHTMAFNRYVAGWIDPGSVVVHRSGRTGIRLMAPTRGGVQMLAIPTPRPGLLLTVEARPSIGRDRVFFGDGGAVVHLIDQRGVACGFRNDFCPGMLRRQGPAVLNVFRAEGPADGIIEVGSSYFGVDLAHVVEVGESLMVADVTVSVEARVDGGFDVVVDGEVDTDALASVMVPR